MQLKALLEETVGILDNLWSNSHAYTQERMTSFIMSFFEIILEKIQDELSEGNMIFF